VPAEGEILDSISHDHAAVSASDPDYVFTDSTGEYGTLFEPWLPTRNSQWR
jgi:hypothetical protein